MDTGLKAFVVVVACGICIIGGVQFYFQTKGAQLEARIGEMDMMLSDMELIEGEVRSPPVLIQHEDSNAFFDKVRELNAKNVYVEDDFERGMWSKVRISRTYYVFTEDYNIGYYYAIRR